MIRLCSLSKRFVWIFLFYIIFLTSLITTLCCSSSTNESFGVQPNDSWTYTVTKARRHFEYSIGLFKSTFSTEGYRLGNVKVPEQEKITLNVLSIELTDPVSISYQLKWNDTLIRVNSSKILSENGIQEALGQGVLGDGFEFLMNDSGISIGEWAFIIPLDLLSSKPVHIWNQSDLPGALEGMETILDLGDSSNKKEYHMWIRYEGSMENSSEEIDFHFFLNANFHWEQITGVLLSYEIITQMTGSYKQSLEAKFNLDLRIDRSDFNNSTSRNGLNFDIIIVIIGLFILISSIVYVRSIL